MEADKLADINVKIGEVKKRILLAEGQKAANAAEWEKQNSINLETIATLKKEIKELSHKCGILRNPLQRSIVIKTSTNIDPPSNEHIRKASSTTTALVVGNSHYPMGAKDVDDAIFLTDLKITENRKQLDLLRHRFKTRQKHFQKLVEQYRELSANKNAVAHNMGEKPPETLEEQANRKLVCQLENEIHKTNVQWMEAEHIRKKYCSIEASLRNDAERFERSLRELESSLNEQQAEINRLQQIHTEAIQMRDAAKVILQRQEQQANLSRKTRERQALDYRKQVELRKMELERIGRKLFLDGKTVVHQDSLTSSSGDPNTAHTHTDEDADPNVQLENVTSNMENLFKHLMEITGATTPHEVLERFQSQKESAKRLSYLRNAAEAEKTQLEELRESLVKELEATKFTDVKETEVNQEVIEKLKNDIVDLQTEKQRNQDAASQTMSVLEYLKERLTEMIYKLQEVDESTIELEEKNLTIRVEDLPKFLNQEADDADFITVLKAKLIRCDELAKQQEAREQKPEVVKVVEDDLLIHFDEPPKSPSVPESEKPQPMPMCYYNLLTGRTQRAAGTSSSSPEQAPAAAAANEEESEVPTRNYFKRQSALIVESKSRRKPFRAAPAAARRK